VKGVTSKEFSNDIKKFREVFRKSQERINNKLEYFYSPYSTIDAKKQSIKQEKMVENPQGYSGAHDAKKTRGIRKTFGSLPKDNFYAKIDHYRKTMPGLNR
jgi:DNA replication protein DnaD